MLWPGPRVHQFQVALTRRINQHTVARLRHTQAPDVAPPAFSPLVAVLSITSNPLALEKPSLSLKTKKDF
jgi:hypothetical protein